MAPRLREEERSLDADQLRAIEAALPGKLRAHQLSEAFIDRYAEELVQQALAEYARACEQGQAIDNPGGWIVNTAFRRAIDQLRREGREASPLSAEAALEVTDGTSAPPDEEAIRHIEAEQLHRAIRRLSVPQRQALSLYYFEERSTREGADALGWSEPTFRRRRDAALRALRERFGVIEPVPQQGDRTAIEVGLAAWLSLAGAQGGHASRVTDQLIAAADSVRGGLAGLADRARDFAARLLSSGGGEGIVNVASGPIGKTAGVCGTATAAAMCVTGVIGPGVGGIDLLHNGSESKSRPARVRPAPRPKPKTAIQPTHSTSESTPKPEAARHPTQRSSGSGAEARARRATRAASSQFAPESAAEPAPAGPEPTPEAAPAPESSPAPSPTKTANEQFGP